jgi:hypothetical protein
VYVPASKPLGTPDVTGVLPTKSGKSPTVRAPPLSFTTCLTTVSTGWTSSFVMVHVAAWPGSSVMESPACEPPTQVQTEAS